MSHELSAFLTDPDPDGGEAIGAMGAMTVYLNSDMLLSVAAACARWSALRLQGPERGTLKLDHFVCRDVTDLEVTDSRNDFFGLVFLPQELKKPAMSCRGVILLRRHLMPPFDLKQMCNPIVTALRRIRVGCMPKAASSFFDWNR